MIRSAADINMDVARHERSLRERPARRVPRPSRANAPSRLRRALIRIGLAAPPSGPRAGCPAAGRGRVAGRAVLLPLRLRQTGPGAGRSQGYLN